MFFTLESLVQLNIVNRPDSVPPTDFTQRIPQEFLFNAWFMHLLKKKTRIGDILHLVLKPNEFLTIHTSWVVASFIGGQCQHQGRTILCIPRKDGSLTGFF